MRPNPRVCILIRMETVQQLTKHASRFQLVMGLQEGYTLVRLGEDDYGLYMKRFVNDFGTPLAVRGPLDEVGALIHDLTR